MLADPNWVVDRVKEGRSVPFYTYAYGNPVSNIDPDGNMGVGWTFGFDGILGWLGLGTAGQASVQGLAVVDSSKGLVDGIKEGKIERAMLATGGVSAAAGLRVDAPETTAQTGAPAQDEPTVAVGAYAGGGGGLVITTANTVDDFAGASRTFNIETPAVGISLAWSPTAKTISITTGTGLYGGVSMYKTMTTTLRKTTALGF